MDWLSAAFPTIDELRPAMRAALTLRDALRRIAAEDDNEGLIEAIEGLAHTELGLIVVAWLAEEADGE